MKYSSFLSLILNLFFQCDNECFSCHPNKTNSGQNCSANKALLPLWYFQEYIRGVIFLKLIIWNIRWCQSVSLDLTSFVTKLFLHVQNMAANFYTYLFDKYVEGFMKGFWLHFIATVDGSVQIWLEWFVHLWNGNFLWIQADVKWKKWNKKLQQGKYFDFSSLELLWEKKWNNGLLVVLQM